LFRGISLFSRPHHGDFVCASFLTVGNFATSWEHTSVKCTLNSGLGLTKTFTELLTSCQLWFFFGLHVFIYLSFFSHTHTSQSLMSVKAVLELSGQSGCPYLTHGFMYRLWVLLLPPECPSPGLYTWVTQSLTRHLTHSTAYVCTVRLSVFSVNTTRWPRLGSQLTTFLFTCLFNRTIHFIDAIPQCSTNDNQCCQSDNGRQCLYDGIVQLLNNPTTNVLCKSFIGNDCQQQRNEYLSNYNK